MKKFTIRFVIIVIVFVLAGCATVEDVRRATDLMRTDNELARILEDDRPIDQIAAETDLINLATHAKGEADALKGTQGKIPDAIAYYRIASTAYWRSGSPGVVNLMFEVSNSGTDLCSKLGDRAPDRDCLFLRLVIPFAGLESNANGSGLSGLLDNVNFNDENASSGEIDTMGKIQVSLIQAKSLVQKILDVGEDDRLLSHPGMREYFCDNAKQALDFYDPTAAVFVAKVKEFHENFPNNSLSLGVTLEEARELRKLEKDVPSFCQ